MKKIIRLTESELHGLVQHSVQKILREQNENGLLLQSLAQTIIQQGSLGAVVGENDAEFRLQGGKYAYITYTVDSNPYMQKGMRSYSYDVPDDSDEIVDNPIIEVGSIEICDDEGHCMPIRDNGIVKKALESVIDINYDINNIPSEDDYYYNEE